MIRVSILGSGNVATHLISAFLNSADIQLVQVFSRNLEKIKHLEGEVLITNNLHELELVDVTIVAISDDSILGLSKKLKNDSGLIAHTSGTASLNELKGNYPKGVFYPLQTFSKEKKFNLKKVPICIEADSDSNLLLLEKLATGISDNVYFIDSKQRQNIHIAAVFVNNFSNHLYEIGNQICKKHNIPFEILQPLIKETAKKVKSMTPSDAQTGPAKRNDQLTIEKHLSTLSNQQQEIYKVLTKSISKAYN